MSMSIEEVADKWQEELRRADEHLAERKKLQKEVEQLRLKLTEQETIIKFLAKALEGR